MTSLSSHFGRQKYSSAWRATWLCPILLRKVRKISRTAKPGVVGCEVLGGASPYPLTLNRHPDDELHVPNLIVSSWEPSDGLQAIWPRRHSRLLPGLPPGNRTAESGIASDELGDVPARVVLDFSLPVSFCAAICVNEG